MIGRARLGVRGHRARSGHDLVDHGRTALPGRAICLHPAPSLDERASGLDTDEIMEEEKDADLSREAFEAEMGRAI